MLIAEFDVESDAVFKCKHVCMQTEWTLSSEDSFVLTKLENSSFEASSKIRSQQPLETDTIQHLS